MRFIETPATVNYLESRIRPKPIKQIRQESKFEKYPQPISIETYRKLYFGVGEKWHWLDRMVMPDEELASLINAPNNEIFLFSINGMTAGFAEFVKEEKFTEIAYFGLLPDFVGKGWGHYFLQLVIQQAWSYQPEWIQLNTCSLDHPNALGVYQKAGFNIVRTEIQQRKKAVAATNL